MRPGAGTAGIKVHARPTRTPPPAIPTLQRIPLAERKSHLENNIADEVERWAYWKMEAFNGYERRWSLWDEKLLWSLLGLAFEGTRVSQRAVVTLGKLL